MARKERELEEEKKVAAQQIEQQRKGQQGKRQGGQHLLAQPRKKPAKQVGHELHSGLAL